MSIDFKNNIKNIRTKTSDYQLFAGGNCPVPCLEQFFSRIYTNLKSSPTGRNFSNSRPIYVIL